MPAHFLTQLRAAVAAKLSTPPLAAVPDAAHYFTEKREYDAELDVPSVVIYTEGFDRETRALGGRSGNACRVVVRCIASGANAEALAAEIAKQVEQRWFATPADQTLGGLCHRVLIDGADQDVVREDRVYAQVELRILATVHAVDGRPDLT